jgi:hypothetical protein
MLFRRFIIAVVVCTTAAACAADSVAAPLTSAELCARSDSVRLALLGPNSTPDDETEAVARLLPGGFGGLTTTYMYLKQPSLADTVRGTARALAACPGDVLENVWSIVQHVEIRQGQYDWVELRGWYTLLLRSGVTSSGLFTADIDEGINRLAFTFSSQATLDSFRARALTLGVPDAALDLRIGSPPVSAALAPGF